MARGFAWLAPLLLLASPALATTVSYRVSGAVNSVSSGKLALLGAIATAVTAWHRASRR
jgi:hypothetical protein